jgi:hypothetical protein
MMVKAHKAAVAKTKKQIVGRVPLTQAVGFGTTAHAVVDALCTWSWPRLSVLTARNLTLLVTLA